MHTLFRRGGLLLAIIAIMAIFPVHTSRAETRSLFGRTAAFADMLYSDMVLTPDNRFVLFRADLETDGVYHVYRASLQGGQPVKLSGAVTAGKGVRRFALSPNGARAVYTSAQEVENREELYSVPVENGSPVKLSGPMPNGGNVESFRVAPNNGQVIYLADQDANDVVEPYTVPLAGGTVQKLNSPLVLGGDVLSDFGISPNSQFVVYRADQEVNDRYELYSAPLNGSAVQKLNGALAAGGQVDYFRMGPVLNIATCVAKEGSAYELYSVQLNGNPIGKLNAALAANQRVTFSDITPDGLRASYVIGSSFFSGADSILYSVSIFGGASTPLSSTPGADGGVTFHRLSADSKYAVFGWKANETSSEIVYSALLGTGARTTIYNIASDHALYNLSLSPDSAWVVFSDYDMQSTFREQIIYAVPITGGAPVRLSNGNESAFSPLISPRSDRVLFMSYVPGNPTCEESNVASAQIFGGNRRTLTTLCGTRGSLEKIQWSADASRIVYAVNYDDAQSNDEGFEIFVSDGQPARYKTYLPGLSK